MSDEVVSLAKVLLGCSTLGAFFPSGFSPNGLGIVKVGYNQANNTIESYNYTLFNGEVLDLNVHVLHDALTGFKYFLSEVPGLPPAAVEWIVFDLVEDIGTDCYAYNITGQYRTSDLWVPIVARCYRINDHIFYYRVEGNARNWEKVVGAHGEFIWPDIENLEFTVRQDIETIYAEKPEGHCVQAKYDPKGLKFEDCKVDPFKVFEMKPLNGSALKLTQYYSLRHLVRTTKARDCDLSMGLDKIAQGNIHIRFVYSKDYDYGKEESSLALILGLAIGIPAVLIVAAVIGGVLYWRLVRSKKNVPDQTPPAPNGSKMASAVGKTDVA